MGTNILNIGQSALAAAQTGISTVGHNIANASTPGYNRQVVLQTANAPQILGGSYVGQGVSVSQIQRQYDTFIGQQVNAAQTSKNQADSYLSQIQQINNLVADSTAGVTPALQDFFKSVQNLSSSPNGTAGAAARQAILSSAQALGGRFNSLQTRLDQIRTGINGQIESAVSAINTYATQLSDLNETIARSQSTTGSPPNDLLDQRDQLVTELSKYTKVTVVPQDSKYNVFIGNGQPIVIGGVVNQLQTSKSTTDPSRTEVSYTTNGTAIQVAENGLPGGILGGLFDFRSNTLDPAQNAIGRVALGIASNFNDQHALGLDLNGQVGGKFFTIPQPVATPSTSNTSNALPTASITNVSALTTSDYRLQVTSPGNYRVIRVSDGQVTTATSQPITVDGVSMQFPQPPATQPAAGDEYMIRPTSAAAAGFGVYINDPSKVAASAPMTSSAPTTNTGNGKISAGTLDSPVAAASTSAGATIGPVSTDNTYSGAPLTAPATLTFAAPANTLSGFPANATVTVKAGGVTTNYAPPATVPYTSGATISFSGMSFVIANGTAAPANGDTFTLSPSIPVATSKLTFNAPANTLTGFPTNANVTVTNPNTASSTTYPAGTAVPYVSGATYSFSGTSFNISGTPTNGDVFNISPNVAGTGDNRNSLLLAGIQTQNNLIGGTTTIQGAYAQFVSQVGNKTHELQITSASETTTLKNATDIQQSVSGVNLDEEAANLLKYQQAYQAAGKLMQVASQLFETLLAIGR
ncbi:flagellar hook-associated protein FlgK [Undibacterium griseum]|uniref:Flagellar hook-associated protein 1 n=1 Tax=Undibacterium griseum TaxID=2762295 RepID=A0ABR6YQR3_9BURK|nr:flagellar hook-associated protein FlgK [Undibacterium griseum]MBC3886108.1 flagellar hook-associated protein FlgK [Undibacterium griseum]